MTDPRTTTNEQSCSCDQAHRTAAECHDYKRELREDAIRHEPRTTYSERAGQPLGHRPHCSCGWGFAEPFRATAAEAREDAERHAMPADPTGHIAAQQHADDLARITRRAEAIVDAYPGEDDLDGTVGDILADLLVLASCRGLDGENLIERARMHASAELS